MTELSFELAFWHWLILAVLLAGIEILTPGFFFIWLGGAALVTGLAALALPGLGWEYQVLIFALLAACSVLGWHGFRRRIQPASDDATLNRRGEAMIGRVAVLSEAIVSGRGRVRLDDSDWRVAGADLPKGARIRVVASDGSLLKVEPA